MWIFSPWTSKLVLFSSLPLLVCHASLITYRFCFHHACVCIFRAWLNIVELRFCFGLNFMLLMWFFVCFAVELLFRSRFSLGFVCFLKFWGQGFRVLSILIWEFGLVIVVCVGGFVIRKGFKVGFCFDGFSFLVGLVSFWKQRRMGTNF